MIRVRRRGDDPIPYPWRSNIAGIGSRCRAHAPPDAPTALRDRFNASLKSGDGYLENLAGPQPYEPVPARSSHSTWNIKVSTSAIPVQEPVRYEHDREDSRQGRAGRNTWPPASGHRQVDRMVLHDFSSNLVAKVFEQEMGGGLGGNQMKIFDPSRIAFVFDHTFSRPRSAMPEVLSEARRFAAKHGIKNVFDSGSGSLHHVIIENGLWAPGQIVIGCDSHTTVYGALGVFSTGVGNNSMAALGLRARQMLVPRSANVSGVPPRGVTTASRLAMSRNIWRAIWAKTEAVYQAVEYAGPFIEDLSIEDRLLFPLMAIDLGAKAGFINPDAKTLEFAKSNFASRDCEMLTNDPGGKYERVVDIDVEQTGAASRLPADSRQRASQSMRSRDRRFS